VFFSYSVRHSIHIIQQLIRRPEFGHYRQIGGRVK
jgi:hypothetical protein